MSIQFAPRDVIINKMAQAMYENSGIMQQTDRSWTQAVAADRYIFTTRAETAYKGVFENNAGYGVVYL